MGKLSIPFMLFAAAVSAIGATKVVPAGGDFQGALNSAQPGDTIVLQAGATYVGNFWLPANNSTQWITIQSSAMNSLPGPGSRVSPSNASAMPKIVTTIPAAALAMSTGAAYYRFQGIEFAPASGVYVYDLIQVGTSFETSPSALPHDIDFDRDYIHGDPSAGGKRGIALNGGSTTVENCYISGWFTTWQDTQALAGWNGTGPYKIVNNYLEAATETVAFGGSTTSIVGVVPSDILIQNNTFFKPLSWMPGSSSYAGVPMFVKNHLELKNAQRVVIDNNTFDNVWVEAGQLGFQLVFTVRTEINQVPWAVVNDIKVTNNRFRHSAAGINITGHDDNPPGSGNSTGFLIQNNTFEDVSSAWGGDGRLFQLLGAQNVTIDHNTTFSTGWDIVFDNGPSIGTNYTNNISTVGWGIAGNGAGVGTSAWNAYAPGGAFLKNVVVGANSAQYPPNNYYPASLDAVGFTNLLQSIFALLPTSPYKGAATDGTDIGANLPSATSSPTTPPTPTNTIPTGWVNIIAKHSGKCLDVAGISPVPGAPLIQWACWGGDNQKFSLTAVNGGYEITAKHDGLQLDIAGGPSVTWDGGSLIQWPYWGGSNEIFTLQPVGDGTFNIIATSSGKCLDVTDVSPYDGAHIQQWSCGSVDNQKWSLVPVQ